MLEQAEPGKAEPGKAEPGKAEPNRQYISLYEGGYIMSNKIKLYTRKQIYKMDYNQLIEYQKVLFKVTYPTDKINLDLLDIEDTLNKYNNKEV